MVSIGLIQNAKLISEKCQNGLEDVWEVAVSKQQCICFSEQWLNCKSCISPSLAMSWAGTGSTEPRVRQVTVRPLRGGGSRPACSCGR